jgi:hypothetical protein
MVKAGDEEKDLLWREYKETVEVLGARATMVVERSGDKWREERGMRCVEEDGDGTAAKTEEP